MLKELVKERLMVAADEIFGLFERTIASYEEELERTIASYEEELDRTIASYEEELSRTREENERQRQQLEAFCKTQIGLHVKESCGPSQEEHPPDPQGVSSTLEQEDPQPPHIKEEEEELWTTQEEECLLGLEKADLSKLPPTGVSVKTEDHEDEPQADSLFAPLSNSDGTSHSDEAEDREHTQEPLSSDADCEGDARTHTDNKRSARSKKKTAKKWLTCSICAKCFPYESHLTLHMRTHTREKPFSCSVCGKGFSQKGNMVSHMTTHTEEKPFSCSVCGEKFSRKSYLVLHTRTHTGEKPFSCSVCGQRLSRKSNIMSHMRTHTGEKPFSCSVCERRFSHKISVVKHMRTHKGKSL
ncbi:zinc finger protein 774-like [Dunckerocampus dactyliophorus]|uniref:zinc finger protein 774-like n=1 Tax=Dunckerocampus dactyliophorus TaxID=161453 RepID=UPI002406275C|nr:zinc finger protein 774-like [Dunckerocampus dactyliophorus]